MEFKNFDFLPPAILNLLVKCKCALIFMNIYIVNNETTLNPNRANMLEMCLQILIFKNVKVKQMCVL